MVKVRDNAQISDYVPDIALSGRIARQAQVNGESRTKGRAGVFLPAFPLHLPPLA